MTFMRELNGCKPLTTTVDVLTVRVCVHLDILWKNVSEHTICAVQLTSELQQTFDTKNGRSLGVNNDLIAHKTTESQRLVGEIIWQRL